MDKKLSAKFVNYVESDCSILAKCALLAASSSSGSASSTPVHARARECSCRAALHSAEHTCYLRHVVFQHVFDTALERDAGRWAARAGAHELDGDHTGVLVKAAEDNVTAILRHRRPNARLQELLYHRY